MSISKEKMAELFAYLSALKGWGVKNFGALIVEWEDEDGLTNWCDDEWTEGYIKRCGRDTKVANDVFKILGWDRNMVRFIKSGKNES